MLVVISAFLAGVAFIIVIEVFIIYRWFLSQPYEEPKLLPSYTPVTNPQDIAQYCGIEDATESERCMFLNLIFQFLWKEWRDSPKTRNFFIRRMNLEFQEMLLNKAAGKLMEQITVRDYHLGDSLPIIKKATVMKIDSRNPVKVPREIDIALDIEYSGGFIISLDVDLIFGKSTHITVKLNQLRGRLRLQFTRNPCTHWSFSFYEDPFMDLAVESNFQGRNLPKLTSFIHNQIRRAIKKKHTFPRYKVRYKPFFIQEKPQDGKNEVFVHSSLLTVGKLDVEIVECTRLIPLPRGSHIYCSLSLDSLPWKEDMPLRRSLWPVHEVLICRSPSGGIGVSFYREFEIVDEDKREIILIKSISPNSPVSQVDIQKGDILLSVNNVDIVSMKQAVRLIKNAGHKFTFKLQRPPIVGEAGEHSIINSNEIFEEAVPEELPYGTDARDSFDYNSIVLQDEDSEMEEFVNIVVRELSEDLIEDDSTRKKFYDEVKSLIRTTSMDHTTRSSDADISEYLSSQDITTASHKKEASAEISHLNNEISNSRITAEAQNPEFCENSASSSKLEYKNKDDNKQHKQRSFTFFRKNRSEMDLEKAKLVSSNYTTDSSESTSLSDQTSNSEQSKNTLSPQLKRKKIVSPNSKKKKPAKAVEKRHLNGAISNQGDIYEPLGVNARQDTCPAPNADWDNICRHTVISENENVPEDERESKGQKTTLVSANQEAVFNEIFSFDVEKEHQFMSICIWGKCKESFGKDVLLGYVSIPLMDLAVECLSTSSKKGIQTFPLVAGSNRSAVSRTYLRTMMPGLNLSCCNGDITLAFKYVAAVPESDLESEEMKLYAESLRRKNEQTESKDTKDTLQETPREHKFVGAEFYFPTICDYCQNKVWRKVAFQCSVCAMVCHKRCIQKAQTNTYCTLEGVRAKPPVWQLNTMNADEATDSETMLTPEDPQPRPISLAIPNEDDLRPGIKNVCPSPNMLRRRNVRQGRKSSINNTNPENTFHDTILEDEEDGDISDSISTAAVTAKEAGRELFASLDENERESNIQDKVEKLQNEINMENENKKCLRDQLLVTKVADRREKIQLQLRKSEERNQALALLMIQYGAALKECLAMDEPQQCDL